jgi:hypothetical protein
VPSGRHNIAEAGGKKHDVVQYAMGETVEGGHTRLTEVEDEGKTGFRAKT